ncbi:MAG: response regulator [bacterium]
MKEKKLLLVDDAELFLSMEQSFLARDSFDIYTAKSGPEALDIARSVIPDLILLDLFMPEMNGEQVCAELKKDPKTMDIPILIVTGRRSDEALKRCAESGCDGFIYKPILRESLLAAVEEVLVIAQRKFIRAPTELECTVTSGDMTMQTTIHNISEGGVFIAMNIPPDAGSILGLEFMIPGAEHTISSEVTVQWTASLRQKGPLGMGVRFLKIDDKDRDLIRDFAKSELIIYRKSMIDGNRNN